MLLLILIHNRLAIFNDLNDNKLKQVELTEAFFIIMLGWVSLLILSIGLLLNIIKLNNDNKIIKLLNTILKGK